MMFVGNALNGQEADIRRMMRRLAPLGPVAGALAETGS